MNREEKIVVFDVDLLTFSDKKTGEVNDMTRILYLKLKSNKKGYRVLKSYVKGNKIDIINKHLLSANPTICTKAVFEELDTEDGIKLKVVKLDQDNLK